MTITDFINNILKIGAADRMSETDFISEQIREFKASKARKDMLDGERYYKGEHDILKAQRTVIGEGGQLTAVENLPNNRIVDNLYRKMVIQKANYLCGKPLTLTTDDDRYTEILQAEVLTAGFLRKMKDIAVKSLNHGLCYLYVNYGPDGRLAYKVFPGYEVCPGWRDAEHTELDYSIRMYPVIGYEHRQKKIYEYVEVYTERGIDFYRLYNGTLKAEPPYHQDYFQIGGKGANWDRIPIIAFKHNAEEIPLIRSAKSLQDGINKMLSTFENNMEEDARNTILILVNYAGENLGEFRRNLAQYGAVKVETLDGIQGDVKTLSVEVNADNYKAIVEVFKKALIENCMGYDAKDDRIGSNANMVNIMSMYNDIDMDANGTETEYQAALEQLLWFVDCDLENRGLGDFEGAPVDWIFDRDMLINETEVIDNAVKSQGIISDETIVSMHPWVRDPKAELEKLKSEKQEKMDAFSLPTLTEPNDDDE